MRKTSIKPLVIATAIIAVIVSALAFALTNKPSLPKGININTATQPTLGKPNAPVHIVVFEDLKCPNCARFSNELFPDIKKKFIDTGVVKYTLITLAFLPGSLPAGNAALCLYDQNKNYFFPFVEYIYQHQPDETEDWATIPKLLQLARNSVPKANMQKLSDCIFSNKHSNTLQNNLKIAEKIMNPVATPTVYVNGVKADSLTKENLAKLIKNSK